MMKLKTQAIQTISKVGAIAAFIFFFQITSIAQVPMMFNYQGVARNASGVAIANQNIGLKFSLLQGSASGTALYTETHTTTTDGVGLFTVMVGNGTAIGNTFSSINWATGPFWLKTEADLSGGSNYQFLGAMQMVSVPYAIIAQNVAPNFVIAQVVPFIDELEYWIFPFDTVNFYMNNHISWIDGSPETIKLRVDSMNLTHCNYYMVDSTVVPFTFDRQHQVALYFGGSDTLDATHNGRVTISFNSLTGKRRYVHLRMKVKNLYFGINTTTQYLNCTNASDNHNVVTTMHLAGENGAHDMNINNFLGSNVVVHLYGKTITPDNGNEYSISINYTNANGTFNGNITNSTSTFLIECPTYIMSSGGTCEVRIIKN